MAATNELWSKHSMQDFEVAGCNGDRAPSTKTPLRERLPEVIAHFSFKHHVREGLVTYSCSQSRHVRARLRDPEVIPVGANLKMILRRSQRHKPTCQEQK